MSKKRRSRVRLKPRNPLVLAELSRTRNAGAHTKSGSAKRLEARQELRKLLRSDFANRIRHACRGIPDAVRSTKSYAWKGHAA